MLYSVESGALPRQKRRYTSSTTNKAIMAVYHRMVEVIDTLSQLLQTQSLTDITILKVTRTTINTLYIITINGISYKLLTHFSKLFAHIKIIIINNVQYL